MDENNRQEDMPETGGFCSACGRLLQATAVFCPSCGTKIDAGQQASPEADISRNPEASEIAASQEPAPPPIPQAEIGPSQPTAAPPPIPQAETQQAVQETDQSLAGVGVRCVGALIDIVILFIIAYVFAGFTGHTTRDGFELRGLSAFIWWFFCIFYYIIFEGKLGATPAKMMLGLRIIKENGENCDTTAAIIRTVCRIVDHFLFIGLIIMMCSKRKQRFGDQVANTIVIKSRG